MEVQAAEGAGEVPPNIRKDIGSVALLFVLYVIQGIPLGLYRNTALVLQQNGASFGDQGLFSVAVWPFSFKILFAPFVDSVFVPWIGRRRTWVIISQCSLAALFWQTASHIDELTGADGKTPEIVTLTAIYFLIYLVTAVQDVAVDGWCLTMLSEENVAYASTINALGQATGFLASYLGFMFAASYGLTDFPTFVYACSAACLIVTILVAIFKSEKAVEEHDDDFPTTVRKSIAVVRNPYVKKYLLFLITAKVAWAVADPIGEFALLDLGLKKETMAVLAVPLGITEALVPFLVAAVAVKAPLSVFRLGTRFKLVLTGLNVFLLYAVDTGLWPGIKQELKSGGSPLLFYAVAGTLVVFSAVMSSVMFNSQMTFHCAKADPVIGGTYMTLLNVVGNLSAAWPAYMGLTLVDFAAVKKGAPHCTVLESKQACVEAGCKWYNGARIPLQSHFGIEKNLGSTCDLEEFSGVHVVCAVAVVFGVLWQIFLSSAVEELQEAPKSAYKAVLETDNGPRPSSVGRPKQD
eukprot:Hpha_TRINITY_DN13832_c0_g2::TRINITY_DN13832_c0_g2_i1::g.70123::m.70123/K03372/ACATN, SLC33A1; MFS transporter, PAT family, solute carrier family 33 (acetyl-CoA transportor), member 1